MFLKFDRSSIKGQEDSTHNMMVDFAKMNESFFENNKSGLLVSRIMSDVYGIRNLVGTGLVQLFGGTITAIVSLFLSSIN